nr:S24 family peptidase [uncultured Massilia sp.]
MLLSERIKLAMDEAGLSQVDLARACGVKPPSVHGWLSGKSKFLRGENLLQAARALNVNQDWLATGTGPMREAADSAEPLQRLKPGTFKRVEAVDDGDPRMTSIPRVRLRLRAGINGFDVEPEHGEDVSWMIPTAWIQARGFKRENLISIGIHGESMEPSFYQGDSVILNTADREPTDGGIFAVNYEGEPIVKRLTRDAGRWWLTSDNSDQRKYQRKVCEGERCIIIGRVVKRETERF